MRVLRLAFTLFAGAALLSAQTGSDARTTYNRLQAEVSAAYKAKQFDACREALLKVSEFTHGGGRVTMNLASISALSGKTDDAFGYLHRYLDMGLVINDLNKDEDLRGLQKDHRWAKIFEGNERNRRGIAGSKIIRTISDHSLLTEDIAWDPKSRSFFLTSVRGRKIVRVSEDGKESVFANLYPDPGWPLFAAVADTKRRVLWVTAAAMPNSELAPEADAGRSALLKIDLDTGEYLRRFDLPQEKGIQRVLGDAALLPNGNLIISDGRSGGVFRFSDGTFTRVDGDDFVSPQTPAISPDGRYAFVADYVRGIGRIDLDRKGVVWLSHDDESVALEGIDGLALSGKTLFAIQNGTSPARIIRIKLDAAMTSVESVETVEANSFGLGEPTHGVFTDRGFVFIANAGWDQLTNKGRMRPDIKPTPPTLRLVSIPR